MSRAFQFLMVIFVMVWVMPSNLFGQDFLLRHPFIPNPTLKTLPGPDTLEVSTRYGDLLREYLGNRRIGIATSRSSRIAWTTSVGSHFTLSASLRDSQWLLKHATAFENYHVNRYNSQAGLGLEWNSAKISLGGAYRADGSRNNTTGNIFGTVRIGKIAALTYQYTTQKFRLNSEVNVDTSSFYPNFVSRRKSHQVALTWRWHRFTGQNSMNISTRPPNLIFHPTHNFAMAAADQGKQLENRLTYTFTGNQSITAFGSYALVYPDIQFFWQDQVLGQFNAQQDTIRSGGLEYGWKNTTLSAALTHLVNFSRLQSRTYPFTSVWADLSGTFFYHSNDLDLKIVSVNASQTFRLQKHRLILGILFLQLDGRMKTTRHTWSFLGSIQNYNSTKYHIDHFQILAIQPQWDTGFNGRLAFSVRLTQFIPIGGEIKSDLYRHEPGQGGKYRYRGGLISEVSIRYALNRKR